MGSLFTTSPDSKISIGLGKKQKVPFYLQFVPGNVVGVVTSPQSMFFSGDNTINSVMAIAHISNKIMDTRYNLSEKNRYYPLFRGMVDVPAKGDPVLLCTISGRQFYLGPLNIDNNVNWNDDNLKSSEESLQPQRSVPAGTSPPDNLSITNDKESSGESINFHKHGVTRLNKKVNAKLDFKWYLNEQNQLEPYKDDQGIIRIPPGKSISETHGDMLFEGRHGNSVRIGSRYIKPYIIISNDRFPGNKSENFSDGSLISMTSRGSIRDNFPPSTVEVEGIGTLLQKFKLSSDKPLDNKRFIRQMINLNSDEPSKTIYDYNKNQMLITSDRITIDSKKEDTYISSIRDIHMGTGRNLTISTNEGLFIESSNIYLGRPKDFKVATMSGVCQDDEAGESYGECTTDSDCEGTSICVDQDTEITDRNMQPLVLGNELVNILQDLIKTIGEAMYVTPSGTPAPLIDSSAVQISNKDNPATDRKSLKSIQGELQKILSYYHYIEPNNELTK